MLYIFIFFRNLHCLLYILGVYTGAKHFCFVFVHVPGGVGVSFGRPGFLGALLQKSRLPSGGLEARSFFVVSFQSEFGEECESHHEHRKASL